MSVRARSHGAVRQEPVIYADDSLLRAMLTEFRARPLASLAVAVTFLFVLGAFLALVLVAGAALMGPIQ